MGSRAVVIVCGDEAAARAAFGVIDEGIGIIYTRTGRRFFDDAKRRVEGFGRRCLRDDAARRRVANQ